MKLRQLRPTSRRRGATLVFIALVMIVTVGMVAFAVDLGWMYMVRSQLQTAVDAGALAATIQLKQNNQDVDAAVAAAEEFVQLNRVGWLATVPEDVIVVEAGTWDADTETFTSGAAKPNAARVGARVANEPLFFAGIFGQKSFAVPRSAIAKVGGNRFDIVMTLDLSGSMKDYGRIQALQAAAPTFVNTVQEVGDDDRIGVFGYGAELGSYDPKEEGHTGVVYTLTPKSLYPYKSNWVGVREAKLTSNFAKLRSGALSKTSLIADKYDSYTPIGAAIRDSAHYLSNNAREDVDRVIVLMSDGHANRPESNAAGYARDMAKWAAGLDIIIYTISLGHEADLKLMEDIATIGGGKHFEAQGTSSELPAKLKEAFRHVAGDLKQTQLVQ
jgi:Mg-chelatase subunit ChlD